ERPDGGGFGRHGIRVQQWMMPRPLKGLSISTPDGAAEAAPLQSKSSLSTNHHRLLLFSCMDLFALTRRLIDIESITPNESAVGDFLCAELRRRGLDARTMPVE